MNIDTRAVVAITCAMLSSATFHEGYYILSLLLAAMAYWIIIKGEP